MSAVDSAVSSVADFATVKVRQQAAWSTGNYAVVGTTLQMIGDDLCEALDLRAGSRVFDGERQAALLGDLMTLIESRNRSGDATLVLPSEYLEVVVERL